MFNRFQKAINARNLSGEVHSLFKKISSEVFDDFGGDAFLDELSEMIDKTLSKPPSKEKIFILPGFMGSKLSVKSNDATSSIPIWFDIPEVVKGNLGKLAWPSDSYLVDPTGALEIAYMRMLVHLCAKGFDVEILPYDWRLTPQMNADVLMPTIKKAGPASILAHSQGGRVARALCAADLDKKYIKRVVTFGTPHFGLYAPVEALAVQSRLMKLLALLDATRDAKDVAKDIVRSLPGLLELMPNPAERPQEQYFSNDYWPSSAVAINESTLKKAKASMASLVMPDDRFKNIVGCGRSTIVKASVRNDAYEFEYGDGDGWVPHNLCKIPNVDTWYTGSYHPFMANDINVINACADLVTGDVTSELPREAKAVNKVNLDFTYTPPETVISLFDIFSGMAKGRSQAST